MRKAVILLVVLLFDMGGHAAAEQRHFETIVEMGEGAAAIEGGDYIDARQKAWEAALQEALWKAVDAMTPTEQLEVGREAISTNIIARAAHYLQGYKFTDEAIDPANNQYKVSLECTFFSDRLSRSLEKGGVKVIGMPKAVVVIDERPMEIFSATSFLLTASQAEDMFGESLTQAGYKPLGRAKVRTLKNDGEVLKAIGGDAASLRWLVGQCEASLVVAGEARASLAEGQGQVTGTVSVRVYDGQTLALLWSRDVSDTVQGREGADRFRAVRQASERMNALLEDFLQTRPAVRKAGN